MDPRRPFRRGLVAARRILDSHAPDQPLWRVANALMASPFGRSDWCLAYWRRECLFSVEARKAWVEPDRLPLPW